MGHVTDSSTRVTAVCLLICIWMKKPWWRQFLWWRDGVRNANKIYSSTTLCSVSFVAVVCRKVKVYQVWLIDANWLFFFMDILFLLFTLWLCSSPSGLGNVYWLLYPPVLCVCVHICTCPRVCIFSCRVVHWAVLVILVQAAITKYYKVDCMWTLNLFLIVLEAGSLDEGTCIS